MAEPSPNALKITAEKNICIIMKELSTTAPKFLVLVNFL